MTCALSPAHGFPQLMCSPVYQVVPIAYFSNVPKFSPHVQLHPVLLLILLSMYNSRCSAEVLPERDQNPSLSFTGAFLPPSFPPPQAQLTTETNTLPVALDRVQDLASDVVNITQLFNSEPSVDVRLNVSHIYDRCETTVKASCSLPHNSALNNCSTDFVLTNSSVSW